MAQQLTPEQLEERRAALTEELALLDLHRDDITSEVATEAIKRHVPEHIEVFVDDRKRIRRIWGNIQP